MPNAVMQSLALTVVLAGNLPVICAHVEWRRIL
jgi:hypothetical protein